MASPKEGREVVRNFQDNVNGKVCTYQLHPMHIHRNATLSFENSFSAYLAAVLITGPSKNSLAAEMALTLSTDASPAMILLLGRSRDRIAPVLESISAANSTVKAVFIECDLTRFDSVRAAVTTIKGLTDKIHVIINSAATMANPEYSQSVEGVETQFVAGYLGHFLLTCSLIDLIVAAGDGARIVNLASMGYVNSDIRYEDVNFQVRSPVLCPPLHVKLR
jgi:NAD(P)-dependent dehydrogenase (short-subunit alcohol dehydrogenase family)